MLLVIVTCFALIGFAECQADHMTSEGLPLFYWQENPEINFGDYISLKLVERIVGKPVKAYRKKHNKEKQLLAIGSILYFANEDDVVWGSGVNGKRLNKDDYNFKHLDVRAVRGPLTRAFLVDNFQIDCPEVYGDPALLFPYFFSEFEKKKEPFYDYIVIPHYTEIKLFPKTQSGNIVYPTEPWDQVIMKILNSKFIISSSLHGIIIAEAYGIPARLLRITENEPFLKYQDYYIGTNRPNFKFAQSVEEALKMGGEPPFKCDLEQLYEAFPREFWPNSPFKKPDFSTGKKHHDKKAA